MPGRFTILEHPSDIGILAVAETRNGALEAAARGITSVIADPVRIACVEDRPLKAVSAEEVSLPVLWLSEILYYFDAEGMLFAEFIVERWSATEIEGRARGERFDPERHRLRTQVKAITYHQFHLGPTREGWELRVFLDV